MYIEFAVDHTQYFVWEQYSRLTTNTVGIRSHFIIYNSPSFNLNGKTTIFTNKVHLQFICCVACVIVECLSTKLFFSYMLEKAEIQIYEHALYPSMPN